MRSRTQGASEAKGHGKKGFDPAGLIERRSRLRFPFKQRVRFKTLTEGDPVSGIGWVVNISSCGVLVAYPHEVTAGTQLELNIDWPTRLDGRIPLQLIAVGTVVRSGLFSFAAGLERYHFRTAGRRRMPANESLAASGQQRHSGA